MCGNLDLPDLILLGRGSKGRRDLQVCSFACVGFLCDSCPRAVIFGESVLVFIVKAPRALGTGFEVCKSK